jgi:hypothetical protein
VPSPGYLWYQDTLPIQWATNSTLLLTNLSLTAGGNYRVVVSNGQGSVTSNPALLIIHPAGVAIDLHPFLSITGVVGNTYGIGYTTDLSQSNSWISLTNLTLSLPIQEWIDMSVDAAPGGSQKRFYRVTAIP